MYEIKELVLFITLLAVNRRVKIIFRRKFYFIFESFRDFVDNILNPRIASDKSVVIKISPMLNLHVRMICTIMYNLQLLEEKNCFYSNAFE